MCLCKKIKTFS